MTRFREWRGGVPASDSRKVAETDGGGYAGYTQRMPKRPKVEPFSNPTLFDMEKSEKGPDLFSERKLERRPYSQPNLLLGTSSFTASGWEGSFYPKGMKS